MEVCEVIKRGGGGGSEEKSGERERAKAFIFPVLPFPNHAITYERLPFPFP